MTLRQWLAFPFAIASFACEYVGELLSMLLMDIANWIAGDDL